MTDEIHGRRESNDLRTGIVSKSNDGTKYLCRIPERNVVRGELSSHSLLVGESMVYG